MAEMADFLLHSLDEVFAAEYNNNNDRVVGERVPDETLDDVNPDYLALNLGLGLGFPFEPHDFFPGRAHAPPRTVPVDPTPDHERSGLRIAGFFSDSDSDSEIDPISAAASSSSGDRGDLDSPLCWDCFCLDGEHRRRLDSDDDDLDWEDVDGGLDGREALIALVGGGSDEIDSASASGLGSLDEEMLRVDGWEFGGLERDEFDFLDASDHEFLTRQFAYFDSPTRAHPPTAKSVVESLPSVALTVEDLCRSNTLCAICKDEISLEEPAKQLPCSHHYHGPCILPWLRIRNTCPVCRYELPTDDREYEDWKVRRVGPARLTQESADRFDFEFFPDLVEVQRNITIIE
ncbi:uncharacterized protein [Typha angustifolia]|uniref:uncharacterized protein n=1 Tax=Typha angustifolia TaxID=59011 RepID=UPI003C2B4E1E